MTRFLTFKEVLVLHRLVISHSGGMDGIRDRGGLESSIAQPQMTFASEELYPTFADKAVALGYSLVCNHPFLDGNKRIGHAAMETFLLLNGWELLADVDDQERIILALAAGNLERDEFASWVCSHLQPI